MLFLVNYNENKQAYSGKLVSRISTFQLSRIFFVILPLK